MHAAKLVILKQHLILRNDNTNGVYESINRSIDKLEQTKDNIKENDE